MPKHVKILGAGPAGLTAAITLAKQGYHVLVYEKGKDCGARFKGDLQGLENWTSHTDIISEFRSLGLDINFQCTPFHQMHAVNADLDITSFTTQEPLLYLVKRGTLPNSLDSGLKEQALRVGVEILFETTGPETAVDIVATGPVSKEKYGLATGIVFETNFPDTAYGMLNNDNAYLGYSYLLVTGGYGCMATVVFDRYSDIRRQFESVKHTFIKLTDLTIKNPWQMSGFANFSHRGQYVKDRRFYVGEAAGLQDMLWGFGMRYAVRSGHLAATCLMEDSDYRRAVQAMFADSLRASIVNRACWERLGNKGYSYFLKLGERSKAPKQFLYKTFQYSLFRRMAFPLALFDLQRRHRPSL